MAIDKKQFYRNKGNKKFSQRFNRLRYDDPEFEMRGKKVYFEEIETDDYWNPYAFNYQNRSEYLISGYDILDNYEQEYNDDKLSYLIFNELIKILHSKHNSQFNQLNSLVSGQVSMNKQVLTRNDQSNESIEVRLYEYKKRLKEAANDEDGSIIANELSNSISKFNAEEYVIQKMSKDPRTIKNLVLFAPFWKRSPLSWENDMNSTIFEYVFGVYEAPDFITPSHGENYSKYYEISSQIDNLPLYWYILISQGGSLNKMSNLTKLPFNKKSIKFLYKVPYNMSFEEGVIFAEILRNGGGLEHLELLSGFRYDSSTINWIVNNSKFLTDQECNLILNWVRHQSLEAKRHNLKPFSWKGRSPKRTLERAVNYHQAIYDSAHTDFYWKKNNYDWSFSDEEGKNWNFIELVSSQELSNEGAIMNHCVGSYDYNCAHGASAIVSLRKEDEHRLTIELDTINNRIIQARGIRNQLPTLEEKDVLAKWIRNKGICVNNNLI